MTQPNHPSDPPPPLQPGPPAMTPPDPGEYGRDRTIDRPDGRCYNEEAAAELRGSLRRRNHLFELLFRPARFMLAHAVHVPFSHVFMIMWLAGAMSLFDRLQLNSLTGRGTAVWNIDRWNTVWTLAVIFGPLRGMVSYGIGGLWFRARLYMCGVRGAPWDATGRVYAFLQFPAAITMLVFYAAVSIAFDSFQAFQDSEDLIWGLLSFIPICVVLYSSILAYASVRGVFNARRVWAVLWFLVLPIAVRLVALVGVMVIAWMMATAPKPDLDNPKHASIATMTVQYPGNWVLTPGEPDTGPARLIELQPTGHDAHVAVEILFYDPDSDPVAETEAWLVDRGFELLPHAAPRTRWGRFEGKGFDYKARLDGQEYVLRMFFSPMAHDGWLEVREIIHADSAKILEPGLEFVRRSVAVRDPAALHADVNSRKTLEAGGVRFQAPGNWWLTRWIQDDAEPGVPPDFQLRAESGQMSMVSILGYSNSAGARSEVGRTLANLGILDRMEDERPLDQWLGLEGLGVEGIDRAREPGQRDRLVRLIVSERGDGTFVEVLQIEYLDTEPLTSAGFALIELTFRVDPRTPEGEGATE